MDVSKLAYGSREIDCLSDFVILCFTVRCFRDSGGGKDVLPFASDLLTCKCVLNCKNFMQLQYKLQYCNGMMPQLERIILTMASLKSGMKDKSTIGMLKN
jgi:hypothetical protein